MIRVTIVAPAMAVRAGLRALISDDEHIQVIAEGATLAEMNASLLDADVVIWSPTPVLERETAKSEIRNARLGEGTALLFIHDDPGMIEELVTLGVRAWGVLDSESTQAEIVTSIQALNEGLIVANPIWLNRIVSKNVLYNDENNDHVEPLTDREIEILQQLAYGLTNKQIALKLKISSHTVKFHVSAIYNKMGTTNRVETVNLGLKKGLIVL